jgi:hypothetical protein
MKLSPINLFIKTYVRGLEISTFAMKTVLNKNETTDLIDPKENLILDDITRSSIVMCVASMDNYFTNKFVEMLVPVLKKGKLTESLIKLIEDSGLNTYKAISLLSNERPLRTIKNMVNNKLELYTAQKISSIDDLFLKYGIKNFCINVQKMSKKKTLLRNVELLVKHRHMIVHNGDINQYNNIIKIDFNKEIKRLNLLLKFIKTSEILLNNYLKKL